MVKNKLKNLVVPEVSTEPGLREMETGNYKELAEDEETFKRPVTRLTILSVKKLLEDEDSVINASLPS